MRPIKLLLVLFMLLAVSFSYAQGQEREVKTFTEAVVPYVEKLVDLADKGTDFVVTEAPIVIRQFLFYNATVAWLMTLIGIFIILYSKKFVGTFTLTFSTQDLSEEEIKTYYSGDKYYKYKKIKENKWLLTDTRVDTSSDKEALYKYLPIIGWGTGIAISLLYIFDAIKITFFPKLYLVETFLNLI